MIDSRTSIPIICLLAAATIALAQTPVPAPKAFLSTTPAARAPYAPTAPASAWTPEALCPPQAAAPAPPVPPAFDQVPEPAPAPYPLRAPQAFAQTPRPAAPAPYLPPAPSAWAQTPQAAPAPPVPPAFDQTPEPAPAPYPPPAPPAFAQTPRPAAAPAPPAPPADAPTPRPAAAPRVWQMDPEELDRLRELADEAREKAFAASQIDSGRLRELAEQSREKAFAASQIDTGRLRELAEQTREKALSQIDSERLRELAQSAKEQALAAQESLRPLYRLKGPFPFAEGISGNSLFAQAKPMQIRAGQGDDSLYNAGHRALDNHKYDQALEYFNQVTARAGARADSAWYYKAYTLNKLGRSSEALAALAELRKSYASSRWLDDAKALELEVNQRAGRPVSPEAESDEELKLIAINSIMQSDPERAVPLLENILKSSQPPKVKDRALFVLAQSSAPRAQQVIEQIARGGANPDLQLKAINYLSQRRRQGINQNLLPEIYGSTNDTNVKRAILDAYEQYKDKEHLAQVAKTEKTPELRQRAFQKLASNNPGQPELWVVFQSETSPETRQELLKCMYQDGNSEKLAEVVRTEKDAKTRRVAIEVLASQRAAGTGDLLVSVYNSEQDPQNRQVIIDRLSSARSAKYLVDLARNEKDSKMKLRIVDRLSNMHSKEASDYLMELLSK
jgi:hypothetical protein